MDEPLKCPRCGSDFEKGLILDQSYGHSVQSTWRAGEPTASFWTGTRLGHGPRYPIVTYRCTACGYLESYARPEEEQRP